MRTSTYNPNNAPIGDLPIIYGFNNGGSPNFYTGALVSQDGTWLGSHLCSDETFMRKDLGIESGSRPDRQEDFKAHYPNGYRTEFVSFEDVESNVGLMAAIRMAESKEQNNV